MLMAVFYAFVESGCVALLTELVGMTFLYRNEVDGLIVLAILGQITVRHSTSSSLLLLKESI